MLNGVGLLLEEYVFEQNFLIERISNVGILIRRLFLLTRAIVLDQSLNSVGGLDYDIFSNVSLLFSRIRCVEFKADLQIKSSARLST